MVGRGVYQRVRLPPELPPVDPDHPRSPEGTPGGGTLELLRYIFTPVRRFSRSIAFRAVPGDPMAEILTESFCERCGTRYTFESPRQRMRLKGVKVLSRGLKNFVLSDDTSMDEAMAAARSEMDREVTGHQLDAFHKTFNFCMSCRQYTCPDCWNEVEARCLWCAPHLGHEILPAPFPNLEATVDRTLASEPFGLISENGSDGQANVTEAAGSDVAEVDSFSDVAEVAPDVMEPIELADTVPAELVDVAQAVPTDIRSKAPAQTAGLLSRFRPGQSLDAALDAYERDRSTALTADTAAASTEPQPVGEPAPAAPATPAPEPATPSPEVAPPSGDIVAQPTWQRVAPDPTPQIPVLPPVAAPASHPASAGSSAAAEPEWPAKPEWSTPAAQSAGLPFLGRPAARQGGLDALWAESAREVVTPPSTVKAVGGVQPCVSCGLSLSATARFCRRCGTLQAT